MSWFTIIPVVLLVIVLATVFRAQPPGGRPASRTHLMTAARVVLGIIALVWLVVALV